MPIRTDDSLTNRVSTVDDLERTEGSVAAVLALADLGRGRGRRLRHRRRRRSSDPGVVAAVTGGADVTRAAAGMGVATAASRAIGFSRILVVAAVLGTTYLGNTYQSSNAVSNVLFELLAAGALSAVLVPTFVTHLDRGDQAEAERLAGRLLGIALLVLGAVSIVGIVAAPLIARVADHRRREPSTSRRSNATSRPSCCASSCLRS